MSQSIPEPPETFYVSTQTVACDGGNDLAMGHPRVYLHMNAEGRVECPYCDRLFIYRADEERAA